MNTFILSAYNRYKRYAETTDIKSKLCNRTWIVFNDGGERELYKFREDGTIYIILSGCVTRGTWEYDPSDKSLIITAANQSYMVHPGMHEDILMALQIDGTEECAFLIEENNAQNFAPKSKTELIQYFEEKEQKMIEQRRSEKDRRTVVLQNYKQVFKDEVKNMYDNQYYSYLFWNCFICGIIASLVSLYFWHDTLDKDFYGSYGNVVLGVGQFVCGSFLSFLTVKSSGEFLWIKDYELYMKKKALNYLPEFCGKYNLEEQEEKELEIFCNHIV